MSQEKAGLCGCGCGAKTNVYRGKSRKFIKGHHARGRCNPRFGVTPNEETKSKISATNKILSAEGRFEVTQPGWKHTAAARKKMSDARGHEPRTPRRGITRNCAWCGMPYYRARSVTQTNYCSLHCSGKGNCSGEKNPFYGKHHTEETKTKLRASSTRWRAEGHTALPTVPEALIHGELLRRGVDFLTEQSVADTFCVDVLIPEWNLIIFVDGCYWHACPEHCPDAKKPKTDNARVPYLSKCGYNVELIWEHEIKTNLTEVVQRLIRQYGPSEVTSVGMEVGAETS